MSSSPFRDEMHALRTALSELQNENGELRARLAEADTRLAALAPYERELRMWGTTRTQTQLPDPTEAFIRLFKRLFGIK